MPRQPEPARNNDHRYNIVTTVPGWLKNKIIKHCKKHNLSINQWVEITLLDALRRDAGIPHLRDGHRINDPAQVIQEYLTGERTLKPCGKTDCTPTLVRLDSYEYCNTCGCRTQ